MSFKEKTGAHSPRYPKPSPRSVFVFWFAVLLLWRMLKSWMR